MAPTKDAKLDINDPKTIANIKKSIEKERKSTKKAVINAVKVSAMMKTSKNIEPSPESQYTLPPAQHKYQHENLSRKFSY